jgi:hypothetical protein
MDARVADDGVSDGDVAHDGLELAHLLGDDEVTFVAGVEMRGYGFGVVAALKRTLLADVDKAVGHGVMSTCGCATEPLLAAELVVAVSVKGSAAGAEGSRVGWERDRETEDEGDERGELRAGEGVVDAGTSYDGEEGEGGLGEQRRVVSGEKFVE